MKIGYDAKRAFYNTSGLGNYSRSLLSNLSKYAPEHEYILYKPSRKPTEETFTQKNIHTVVPSGLYKHMGSIWRQFGISGLLANSDIDIFHGLSHELPQGIEKTNVKSVVTMHDVIFLRYPELYSASYRLMFKKKYSHACRVADKIVAISEQSKYDVIKYFNVPEENIDVIYQGCNPIYYNKVNSLQQLKIVEKYNLPKQFALYVGTIEERKNVLGIVKAIHEGNIDIPLVIVGRPKNYLKVVKEYINAHNLQSKVIFLHDVPTCDLPAIYQLSSLFVYPSLFEGFGIPILEALNSGTPVITSKGSCFPEVGGDAARYVEYGNTEEMIATINTVLQSSELQSDMAEKGYQQALRFREETLVRQMVDLYSKVLK